MINQEVRESKREGGERKGHLAGALSAVARGERKGTEKVLGGGVRSGRGMDGHHRLFCALGGVRRGQGQVRAFNSGLGSGRAIRGVMERESLEACAVRVGHSIVTCNLQSVQRVVVGL